GGGTAWGLAALRAEPPPRHDLPLHLARRSRRPGCQLMQAGHNATVFIVDDDVSVREALAWLLRSRQLQSEVFSGGHEFDAVLESGFSASSPCCLLLDVRMPGMSGLAL